MKDFNSFKNEIYKCSKCGLCQAVCPVYKCLNDECCVSRGKFIQLNGFLNGDLTESANLLKDFDLCTSCGACSDFCPSKIDAVTIFTNFKYHFSKKNFFDSIEFFTFKLKILSIFTNLYRILKFDKLFEKFYPTLKNFKLSNKFFLFINSLLKLDLSLNTSANKNNKILNVTYFQSCHNKYINPQNLIATTNLLNEINVEFQIPELGCCGISQYFEGNFDNFKENATNIISRIPQNTDYVICDCASCVYGLLKYTELFENANFLKNKIISIEDLLIKSGYEKTFKTKLKITYHKPCHGTDFTDFIKSKLHNIEFMPIEQSCCGFAGKFPLKYPKIATEIGNKKAQQIIASNADIVVTSCSSCLTGLKLALSHTNIKVLMLSELLNYD